MFSNDGSLLAVQPSETLKMWETSTWERLWSIPSREFSVTFSPDGVIVISGNIAYDVRSGCVLNEFGNVLKSMHGHVHVLGGKLQEKGVQLVQEQILEK